MKKKKIITIGISIAPYTQFVKQIVDLALERRSSAVCIANVHMCIETWRDSTFAEIVNGSEMVTPDGMPLVNALRLLYDIKQDRVAGMDLMPDLFASAEKRKASIYLYGSTAKVQESIANKIKQEYPELRLAGGHSPPFRPLTVEEEQQDCERIIASGAHIVLVALGCPKQERWIANHKGKINAVMVGVGGAFPVFAGLQRRAPQWMCNTSLEWLYRLIQDPLRLFGRYLTTNSLFIFLLAREYLRSFRERQK